MTTQRVHGPKNAMRPLSASLFMIADIMLSLPRLRSRSERVGRCPRADLPESHTAEATGADGVCHQVDDPSGAFGRLFFSMPLMEFSGGRSPQPCERIEQPCATTSSRRLRSCRVSK